MRRLLRAALIGLVLLVVLPVAWVLIVWGVGWPLVWEVPADFRGWASIRFDDPKCPPLATRNVYVVLSTLPSGRGCTSSPAPEVKGRYTRLEYVHPDGTRTRGNVSNGRVRDAFRNEDYLFVGTEDELKAEGGPRRPAGHP